MLTAATAKSQANDVTQGTHKKQMEQIEASILKAVAEGKLECYIYFTPTRAVRDEICSLGYKFGSESSFRNETTIKISWE